MNHKKAVKLIERYAACPQCGSDRIGGKGKLIVDETFIRSCECGWSIEVDENGVEVKVQ